MVYANLYSAIVANVSNALCTLVPRKQPSCQALFEGAKVLLCAEVVRQRIQNHRAVHTAANTRRPTLESRCRGTTISCCVADCTVQTPPVSYICITLFFHIVDRQLRSVVGYALTTSSEHNFTNVVREWLCVKSVQKAKVTVEN